MSSRIRKQCERASVWKPAAQLPPPAAVPARGASHSGEAGAGAAVAHEAQLEEAYRRGFHEGEQAGRAAVDAAIHKLAQAAESLASARARARREAEGDLLRLALAIARRILHRELSVDPEAVGGLIRAALDKMQSQEIHRVRVHPDLEQPVRQALERMAAGCNVQVAAEGGREFGDVIFETERGRLDASVETQIQEIGRGLADLLRGRA